MWDDSSNTVQTVKSNDLGFNYFCITTDEIGRTRTFDLNPVELPLCTGTKANYYTHNDLVLDRYDLEKIKVIAQTAAKRGRKFCTFKCNSKALFEATKNNLFSDKNDFDKVRDAVARTGKGIRSFTYSSDKNIRTITIYFKQ